MKKKIFGTMVVAAAIFTGYSAYDAQNERELTDVALANVEALAHGENKGETSCPDFNYVPNHYITSSTKTESITSNSNGEITVLGQTIGGYAKNTLITVLIEEKNCDGKAEGSCCDQREVGASIL